MEYMIRYNEVSKEELDLFLSMFEDTLYLAVCQSTYDRLGDKTDMSYYKNIIINEYLPINECMIIDSNDSFLYNRYLDAVI